MNSLTIIGNVTRAPELRVTATGLSVCSFSVAVNRKAKDQVFTDYFNISAWRQLGEMCAKYLAKGSKVCVIGPVSVRAYQKNDGTTGANMEVIANNVEFLSPKNENREDMKETKVDPETGYQQVQIDDGLPF